MRNLPDDRGSEVEFGAGRNSEQVGVRRRWLSEEFRWFFGVGTGQP